MELQLGLAPPTSSPPIRSFDLNNFVFETTTKDDDDDDDDDNNNNNNKRSFACAFDECNLTSRLVAVPRTLPLLLWNNHPNDGGDDDDDLNKRQRYNSDFTVVIKNDGDGLVGWPPIQSWRKENICFPNNGGGRRTAGIGCGCGGGGANHLSTFVKVKMEGVGIARKIDLSLHHSFQTLLDTLLGMFDICEMESSNYKLTYQDRDGDWLFADQDVSWRTFVRSVQRLKLVKRSD